MDDTVSVWPTTQGPGAPGGFYWPPGHSVRVVQDAEAILFSPQAEHIAVMDHMLAQMGG